MPDTTRSLALFDAARAAGLPPHRAARYVHHVHLCESQGRVPLTPDAAALAVFLAAAPIPSMRHRLDAMGADQ